MQRAEFRAAMAEEEILEKIESGIQERNVDRSYANNLLVLIAEAVGIPTERSALKKEFEEFKNEIESTRLRKDEAEAIQMDQIMALLERADATSSPREKEIKHFSKRKSLGSQPLEPLQSFYCPITRDVMEDPVETSSGQTFERRAIEKWFADGNKLCPLTMTSLNTSVLRPNKTLRQSIEEWKDRNTMITIGSIKPKLNSEEEDEVLHSLEQLQELCEQRDLHREWVILEDYVPTLIQLLAKNRDIRNHALVILCILAKDTDNAIESIVRSLGRRVGERKLAVELLLELSKCHLARDCIGKVQGCILLLVTMSSSDDSQAARDAQALLENLSFSDQNIIQMAKANYFRHLLQRLSTGPEDVKLTMATTLAEMELTDHNKESLFEGGVLGPLLHFVSHGDTHMKNVAAKALRNLSSLPKIGLQMIKEAAVRPLLDTLFNHSTSSSSLREHAAGTIMHLAVSTMSQESSQIPVSLLESDEDILMLFSLINLTGPEIQQSIIQTFQALCQSPSAPIIKTKLSQCAAIQVLVQLCEHDDPCVRANVVKLFCCLAEGGDEVALAEHLLESGTTLTKKRAAISLCRFSESSLVLSRLIPKRKGFLCFSAPPETVCPVHGGICSTESSFCLIEADAVRPLVRILGEHDPGACEASLDALLTLIEGERLQSGSKVLGEANAIPPIIKFLGSPSPSLQEKALHALERIFRLVDFKMKYGALAQMPLVDITQRGSGSVKSLAARILAHLNVLHDQSSYF
ncbi:u-box domain-containing protein 43 [Quercus suber]|uniref:RING-type E3 ubiquitin transferase n=1 Tax=Quercus suber TaxID=58331 RepID=A0AAW0JJN5_QUESU